MKLRTVLLSAALSLVASVVSAFDLDADVSCPREAFDYMHRAVTGKAPAEDAARFVVDATVSKTGNDAYRIESKGSGVQFTGSNARSLIYAVYDLFSRRAGCRYFWDGDILPRVEKLDLEGLDVREEARFLYRGCRYFGHRSLTRFQAEHWGFEDWKRELDWLVKNRQNVFFARVGMDDLFPRTFPDACSYPDASKPLPGQGEGYDNRSLFWSLEYRGELRRRVLAYARSLGIAFPEDFGTMTHWYTRTPQDFLDNMKPDFLPQATSVYAEPSGLIWDIRQKKWLDAYWSLTETAIREYGSPSILHTQGFSERRCFEDRAKNLQMKRDMNALMFELAAKHYPKSPVFLNSWDFWHNWTMEETREYIKTLDKDQIILLDFCLNAPNRGEGDSQFRNWDVIGKFPYMVGPFRCEPITMIHEDYDLLEERFRPAMDDPMCVGFLDWTENSHPDALQLKYHVENSWRPRRDGVGPLVDELCRDRYAEQRELLAGLWKDVAKIAPKVGRCTDVDALWVQCYAQGIQSFASSFAGIEADHKAHSEKWQGVGLDTFRGVPDIFGRLADVKWRDEFVKRDAMDLARGAADRLILEMTFSVFDAYFAWRQGTGTTAHVLRLLDAYMPLVELMEKLLQLHKDYSLAETFDHMEVIEHIRNPDFDKILIENANSWYCVSHQAECAKYFTTPLAREMIRRLKANVVAGDRSKTLKDLPVTEMRNAMRQMRLDAIRPVEPRSEENWRKTMLDFKSAAERVFENDVLNVAFLGGSITEMNGFRPRVMAALREKNPSVTFNEIAAGLSSTCSDTGAFRFEEDVLKKGIPDLLIVDSAVNDDQDGHFDRSHCLRGMEGAVRHALKANPSCAVVVALMVNKGQYDLLLQDKVPLQFAVGKEVAAHYGAVVADIGSTLASSAKAGGMSWKEYVDCHPSPAGCDMGARVVMEAVDKVFDPTKTPVVRPYPKALDVFSYERGCALPLADVRLGDGWQVSRPAWENIPGDKRGYFMIGDALWTEKAGAVAEFAFKGTSVGALLTAGPDVADLEASIDNGPWRRFALRATYGMLHYPYTQMIEDGLQDVCHTVRIRAVPAMRDGAERTALRINRLFVNGKPAKLPVALKYEDYIYGTSDREIPVYRPGETMTFTFRLRVFEDFDASECTFDWERTGDDGKRETGKAPADRPLVLKTSLDRPGYVRYYIVLRNEKGEAVRRAAGDEVCFDGGAGVDIKDIRQGVPAPADFKAFWKARKEKLSKFAWRDRVEQTRVESPLAEVDLFAVKVPCAGGMPVTGYLSVPKAAKDGKRFPAAIHYYGYGESWTAYATQPPTADRLSTNRVDFFATAHGFDLMRDQKYYDDLRTSVTHHKDGVAFSPEENADPDKAYFCGMTYRVMRAAVFVKGQPAWNHEYLLAEGASMGGLQSIWTAALDPDVTHCRPDIPWCCDMGGTELGRNRGDWYVRWTPALGYYDPVNMAELFSPRCELFIPRLGLGDYICPPTGVTAFYNKLRCVKGAHGFQNTTHGYVSPRPRQMFALRGDDVVEFRDGDPLVVPVK